MDCSDGHQGDTDATPSRLQLSDTMTMTGNHTATDHAQIKDGVRVGTKPVNGRYKPRIEITCKRCDRKFMALPCFDGRKKYCSRKCQHAMTIGRLLERVEKTDKCWLFTGAKTAGGYGLLGDTKGKSRAAHRISWELHKGKIPEGMMVLHKCDVRNCVNPDHLFLGTNRDNMADRNAKGRQARGEKTGCSILTASQVLSARAEYAKGGTSSSKLADKYGVKISTMGHALSRRSWKHLPQEDVGITIDDTTIPDDQELWEAFESDLECSVDCSLCGDRGCGNCR